MNYLQQLPDYRTEKEIILLKSPENFTQSKSQ